MRIHFWPLIYSLLFDVSFLLMETKAHALAIEALAHVQQQSASDFDTKERARQRLEQWQRQLAAEGVEVNPQLGPVRDADALLQRILAEISVAA